MTSKALIREWAKPIRALLLIILVGLFLRIYNLNEMPIFGDEAIYVRWAQIMKAEPTLRFISLTDGKQPLFMWTMIPFLKIFSDPLIAGRLLSAAMSAGTIIGIFTLSYILFFNKKVSLIASGIYAVSSFAVFFDRMALVDSMLACFVIWTVVGAVITAKTKRLDSALLTGFALGAALLTKSAAIFFALLLPITWILIKWPKTRKKRGVLFVKMSSLFLVTYLISFVMYNIQRLGPNFHMLKLRTLDYVWPLSRLITSPLDPLKPFLDRTLEYYWLLGPSMIVILFVLGILGGFKKHKKETLVLLVFTLVPIFIVSEFSKTMTARYVFFSVPFVSILAASVMISNKLSKVGEALLVVFVMHALFINSQLLTDIKSANLPRSERSGYLEEWTAGTGIKQVSEIIREEYNSEPDQKIVVGTEGYFGTLPDGLQAYLNDLPEVTVIGVGVNFTKIPRSLLESRWAGNKTYFAVNNSRLNTNPDNLAIEVVAAYPKALKPDGTQEVFFLYELE